MIEKTKPYALITGASKGIGKSIAYELAKQFAEAIKVPLESVHIDEIFVSRRFKHFKYIFSDVMNQEQEKEEGQHRT